MDHIEDADIVVDFRGGDDAAGLPNSRPNSPRSKLRINHSAMCWL